MLHTLEDFCRWLYPEAGDAFARHYYELVRLAKNRYRKSCYRAFSVPKRDGGARELFAPSQSLAYVQRGVLALLGEGEVSPHATAYEPGCGVRENAAPHLGRPVLVKLDLENFFGSVRFQRVFEAIDAALRRSPLVGRHYLNGYDRTEPGGRAYNQVLSFYFARFCTLDGALPQGAPTSPHLSNLVLLPFDRAVGSYCARRNIVYTRYSDDMAFSGEFSPEGLIRFVRRLAGEHGFALNEGKTVVLGPGSRKKLTGAVVNEKLQADRAYRRRIRQELHYLELYGPEEHLERLEPGLELDGYLRGLMGRIAFVLQLNPDDREFQAYREECAALLRS